MSAGKGKTFKLMPQDCETLERFAVENEMSANQVVNLALYEYFKSRAREWVGISNKPGAKKKPKN